MSKQANIRKGTASEFIAQKAPYTSVSNKTVEAITNPDALAIWTYLQTRAPGWKVIGEHLQKHFGLGRTRYRAAMKNLRDLGLVEHETNNGDSGRLDGRRVIVNFELPKVQESTPSATEGTENRTFGLPNVRQTTPYVSNQEISNKSMDTNGASAPGDGYPPEFDDLWENRPRRDGGDSKKAAYKAYRARLRDGVSHGELRAGMDRYRQYQTAMGKLNTQFVMQMVKFFGPDEHYAQAWGAPANHNGLDAADPGANYDGLFGLDTDLVDGDDDE